MKKQVINEKRSHGSGICDSCGTVKPKLYSSLVLDQALCKGCMLGQAKSCNYIYGPSDQIIVQQIPNRYKWN